MKKDYEQDKMELERLSNETLQEQLYHAILSDIKSGFFKPGDMITSELKLSEQYGVSRVTVRNSIQQLVEEDYLVKRKGKGTFVKSKIYTEAIYKGSSFTDNVSNRNAVPSTDVVYCKRVDAPSEIQAQLHTDQVIEIMRVRKVDGISCIVEIDYLPTEFSFLLTMDLTNQSLLNLLIKQTGIIPAKFIDQFTIYQADSEFAKYLNCDVNTPLLLVTQHVNENNNKTIYINKQYILTSKYIYVKSS